MIDELLDFTTPSKSLAAQIQADSDALERDLQEHKRQAEAKARAEEARRRAEADARAKAEADARQEARRRAQQEAEMLARESRAAEEARLVEELRIARAEETSRAEREALERLQSEVRNREARLAEARARTMPKQAPKAGDIAVYLCPGCQLPVNYLDKQRFMLQKKWHVECCVCPICKASIGAVFKEEAGVAYCSAACAKQRLRRRVQQ